MNLKVSLIIPCRNEENYIENIIADIQKQNYPAACIEVFLIDGESNDKTVQIIKSKGETDKRFKYLPNPGLIVPMAMNIGIRAAIGDYIIRLDAHASYPPDYISKLINWATITGADNVGAVCIPGITKDTPTAYAIAKVFEDRLGVGNSHFRVGVDEPKEVDTVPFGCYRRDVFDRIGLFDERLARVQDYEFNRRLKAAGGKILLIPEITCTYYPRATYRSLWQNRYATGKGIVLVPYFIGSLRATSLRHTVPLFFVLSLILPLLFAFLWRPASIVTAMVAILYVLTIGIRSRSLSDEKVPAWRIAVAFTVVHFSYGIGSIISVFNIFYRVITGKYKLDRNPKENPHDTVL